MSNNFDATLEEKLQLPNSVEALSWLSSSPKVVKTLSGGPGKPIFGEKAIKLVQNLYDQGAVKVTAVDVFCYGLNEDGEGHEDTDKLIIELPNDEISRKRLFDWRFKFKTSRVYKPEPDTGQKYMLVWWD